MVADTPIDIRGFKGLNLREPPGMIQDDELASCINLNVGRAGELRKRTGFTALHNGSTLGDTDVRLIGQYLTPTHSQLIACTSLNQLWHSPDGVGWTKISDNVNAQFAVQYVNKFYIIAKDKLYEWNGTALTAITGAPVGTFCTVYKDRLFTINSEETANSRLRFSAIAEFDNWPTTNFIDVSPGDGDFLVACAVIHDLLIIFKTKSTWALYVQGAPENWVLRNINPEIGCISKYTPREIEGFLFFVGPRGIYKTDGNIFEDISESIEPVFRDRIVNLTTTNIDAAAWWEDRYIVLLHPDASTFRYMVYQLRTGGWTEWVPSGEIIPAFFLEVNSASPAKGLYTGNKAGSGRIYRHGDGVFTDSGNVFPCSFETKDFDFTLPSLMKRGKWLGVDVDSDGTISVTYNVDTESQPTLSFSGTGARRMHKVKGPGYFRVWSLQFSQSHNSDFIFYVVTLYLARKRPVIKAST